MTYSNQEDVSVLENGSFIFVDRQGTNDIYSSLSITKNGNVYKVVMDIYRLGSFIGTASEIKGALFLQTIAGALKVSFNLNRIMRVSR